MLTAKELSIINQAREILQSQYKVDAPMFKSPHAVADYLNTLIGMEQRENFVLLLLDSQHRLIKKLTLFKGTIDAANVYPREIIKAVLDNNAAAVILSHNHPSGVTEPSQADRAITKRIQNALAHIDVSVLDHIIVGSGFHVSFAERGWI